MDNAHNRVTLDAMGKVDIVKLSDEAEYCIDKAVG